MTKQPPTPEELFKAIVALPVAEQQAYLDAHCEDRRIRAKVIKLLEYDNDRGGGLTEDFEGHTATPNVTVSCPRVTDRPLMDSSPSSIDHGRFLPGTVLSERYRIVGLLGKGGMGEVYRADDLELGQSVALKFLPKKVAQDSHALDRFRSEVRLARQVSHPNVCRVYDIGQIEGHWFLSMEYVDGEDLAQLLRRIGRFNSERATELARQLCLGLQAAHEKGVLHRDLKPANIMIDGRGKLLITDFGLAEIADDIRGDDIRSGTPAYMAPEQLAGREVTARSDIYSLGSILHEIYTGKPVWQADSMMELLEKRKDPRPTPTSAVDSVHPAVASVINRCLDPDPAQRPATAINIIAGLPGGDPVQAALAAGKTPSPKMIADSGGEGRLSLPVGGALYALICIVAIAIPFLVDWIRPFDFGDLAKNKPEVLEQSARSFTESFGYETIPGNEACGFQVNENNQFEFWYRQSENLLTPDFPPLWAVATTWQISASNPALVQPGMVTVRLNSAGELMEFLAIPSSTSVNASPTETDWAQLLAQAGINAEDYELDETTADSPELRPPTYVQQIRMWKKRDDSGNEKIIAASYRGKATYFRRYSDPTERGLVDSFQAGSRIQTYSGAVTTLFLIVAVVFAIRNLQTMRVEVPTALKMGLGYLALDLLVWIVQTGAISEIVQNRELAANFSFRSLAAATRLVIYYMAFEPIIRRYWPDNLTAWARLISGRFTDPLIGSNILVGTLIGICWWLCVQSDRNSYPLVNYPTSPNAIMGRYAIAAAISTIQYVALVGLAILAWLVCFRVIFKDNKIASLVVTILLAVSLDPGNWRHWFTAVMAVVIYVRFGLLACLIAQFYVNFLSQMWFTTHFQSWYASPGWATVALIVLSATYGFYVSSMRPRRLFDSSRASPIPG